MQINKGDEFIGVDQGSNRHYKVVSCVPVMEYKRDGSEYIGSYNLRIEVMHVSQDGFLEWNEELYERFRFFDTTSTGLIKLIEAGVIKKKD